jgi:glycerate kinase
MDIVIAPDSFKGSLSSIEVCNTIKRAFAAEFPQANIQVFPMADGGEGTVESLVFATNGKKVFLEACGPYREITSVYYGVLGDHETAVIETAAICGLPMIPKTELNPLLSTTFGIGEAVLHALDNGYRKFIIGLGGSATNDGGFGMLSALGAKFLDDQGMPVEPKAGSLKKIASVDFASIDKRVFESEIVVACDVTNPLCGVQGASYVYGPQKGAGEEQVRQLDHYLQHFAEKVEKHINKEIQNIPGAGAAGGLGFGLLTLGAVMREGAGIISHAIGLREAVEKAELVITGEGRSDSQTKYGKVPYFVARLAKEYNSKTILISGSLGEGIEELDDYFVSCHSIAQGPISLEDCINNADQLLSQSARYIARLIRSFS